MAFNAKNRLTGGTMGLSGGYSYGNDYQGQSKIGQGPIRASRTIEDDLKECLPLSDKAELQEWYKNGGVNSGYHPAQRYREKERKLVDCIERLYRVNNISQSTELSHGRFHLPRGTVIQGGKKKEYVVPNSTGWNFMRDSEMGDVFVTKQGAEAVWHGVQSVYDALQKHGISVLSVAGNFVSE